MEDTSVNTKLEWIPTPEKQNYDQYLASEEYRQRFSQKFKENPLVPLGMLATTCALGYGLYSFLQMDRRMSQLMMRARVLCQGFTLAVVVISSYRSSKKNNEIKQIE